MKDSERVAAEAAWEAGYLAGHLSALDPNGKTPENPYERTQESSRA